MKTSIEIDSSNTLNFVHVLNKNGKSIRKLIQIRRAALFGILFGVLGFIFYQSMYGTLSPRKYFDVSIFALFGLFVVKSSLQKPRKIMTINEQIDTTESIMDIWELMGKWNNNIEISINEQDQQLFDLLSVHVFRVGHTNETQISECPVCERILSAITSDFKTHHELKATFHYLEQFEAVSLTELIEKLNDAISGVQTGLIDPEGADNLTAELINSNCPLETLLTTLDSALVQIGDLFESKDIYYPQVLQSALAVKNALQVIDDEFPTRSKEQKGRILVGVVKGDIHDIGKNIVKMFLEFHGYQIIDIGIDKSPEEFVQAVFQHTPDIVGISAFINTVIPAFKQSIIALREAGFNKPVLAGGIAINKLTVNNLKAELNHTHPQSGEIIYAHNVQEVLNIVTNTIQPILVI